MNIYIKNLIKKYGSKIILDIEDLYIEKGKITGITGSNGSGKSTLLNIISGIDRQYKGEVKYDNSHINEEIINNMTIVFQKPYLFQRSVYDNIAYPLRLRKTDKKIEEKLINKISSDLEISDLLNKKAHILSGGESQKVALARALVFKPSLLLLDEPTSNIDPDYINILEREILRFNQDTKATVILVTHNLEQSKRLCDNIIYVQCGRIGE